VISQFGLLTLSPKNQKMCIHYIYCAFILNFVTSISVSVDNVCFLPGRSPKSIFIGGVGWTPYLSQKLFIGQASYLFLLLPSKSIQNRAESTADKNQIRTLLQEGMSKGLYAQLKRDHCRCRYVGDDFIMCEFCYFMLESPNPYMILQSEEEPADDTAQEAHQSTSLDGGMEQATTVSYMDDNPGTSLTYNPITDSSFYNNYTSGVELGEFLSRPVLIKTQTWTEGTPFDTAFFPWTLYFNDTRIRKKLDNFSLLSCNLKVKAMINASPFYYGCAIMAYQPLTTFNPSTIVNVSTYDDDLVPLSQRPHIWLYPQCNQGGEMTLPFFNQRNWLRVQQIGDFNDMGSMTLREVVALQSANSVAGAGVTIQVYAWAEDVRVTAPTVGLALQSREEYILQAKDEYMYTGPVSAPASAVSRATKILGSLPLIGSYMTATSALAGKFATVASWFGFTNTPVISDVMPFKSLAFHSMASSEIGQPMEKLTIDPKNELTVDPKVVGLSSDDEMMITPFIQRESYVKSFPWVATDAIDKIIFAGRVVPEYSAISGIFRQSTPIAHISHMFKFWRGDIIYRFRFICSKYHRGRVRITWDPSGDIIADAVSSSVAFNKIVDITKDADIEIRVPYMQALPWLQTLPNLQTEFYGDSTFPYNRDSRFDNGNITVRVFTSQTSPVASAPIQMIVSIRAADNFEFAAPLDVPQNTSIFSLQSTDELLYDTPSQVSAGNNDSYADENRFLINMGENIKSFRQLLRRHSLVRISDIGADVGSRFKQMRYVRSRFPIAYGYDANGIDSAKGTTVPGSNFPFNYVFTVPFNWLAPCYIGMRGASHWQFNWASPVPIPSLRARRTNETRNASEYKVITTIASGGTSSNTPYQFMQMGTNAGACGQSVTNQQTQTSLAVSVPMYNQYRMETTNLNSRVNGSSVDDSEQDSFRIEATIAPLSNTTQSSGITLHEYHSIGTDFSFHFFLNVPTLLIYNSPAPN